MTFDLNPTAPQSLAPLEPQVATFFRLWLGQYSEETRKTYRESLADFAYFAACDSSEEAVARLLASGKGPAAAAILAWSNDLQARGKAPSTVAVRLAAMRSMLKQAHELDLIGWTIRIRSPKVEVYKDTAGPGLQRFKSMYKRAASQGSLPLRARNAAIMRLLFDLGLRAGSVVSLDLEHVDLTTSRLYVLAKGKRTRHHRTLPRQTVDALTAWLKFRGQEPGPLFVVLGHNKTGARISRQTVFRLVRELGEQLGIKTSPHKIRHTAVTEAVQVCDLIGAQQFAGHTDPRTTLKYLDNLRDIAGQAANKVAERLDSDKPKKPR